MPKQCGYPECTYNVYSNGYCQRHQSSRTDRKWVERLQAQYNRKPSSRPQPSNKPIKKESKKRAFINRKQYEPSARAHREEIGHCEVCIILANANIYPGFKCCGEPQAIHHTEGKTTIELLLDKSKWLVCCFLSNNWIEANSDIAEKLGLKKPNYNSKLSKFKK